jgi:hypothetical protein
MNWTSIITAGLSGLFGSLLAIVATPTLQHHFWRRQRRAELKLKTVEVVNTLTNRFIQQWIAADLRKERYKPALDWYEEFSAADASVKALFGKGTYQIFKDLEKRIAPDLGAVGSHPSVPDFIEARDAAVKALYEEVV